MVLYVARWDIRPEKSSEYPDWAKTAVSRVLSVPGLQEFRGYRPATGSHEVVVTYEFADMAAWSTWYANEIIQELFVEARAYTTNYSSELWGPSPVVPQPLRAGS